MNDEALFECNETELLAIARVQGLGCLRRGLPHEELVAIVAGEREATSAQLAGTDETRARLQLYIFENIDRVRSQLPGCNGMCCTFPCSEGRHALCFGGNEDTVR